jgi:hypothetical protein
MGVAFGHVNFSKVKNPPPVACTKMVSEEAGN